MAVLGVELWAVTIGTKSHHAELEEEPSNLHISEEKEDYWDKVNSSSNANGGESKGYKQIALFGVDSRQGELYKNTRTDTIMIASINLDTKEVKLCSVFRDTYLNLSNDSYSKCNAAYAKGGAEQAIQMLNMNLDLNITDYITVGFKGVVDTVDALGGVDIDIQGEEITHLNNYQYCIAEDLNRMSDYKEVKTSGVQILTGLQACGYCRIRYTAGSDFKRTERQRNVLTKMVEKAKTVNPVTLTTVASNAAENVVTSFDLSEILEFAKDAASYNIVGSEGFPFADYRDTGTIGNAGSCVIPIDLETNVSLLHEYLFGVKDYEPSSTVKECSEAIKRNTAPYL